jgi:hypothetical protein
MVPFLFVAYAWSTYSILSLQLLEESEEGKERPNLRMKLEVPLQTVLNLQPPLEYTKEVHDYKSLIRTLTVGMCYNYLHC